MEPIVIDTSVIVRPINLWGAMVWPLLGFAIWWVAVSQKNRDSIANQTLSIFNLIIVVIILLGMQSQPGLRI